MTMNRQLRAFTSFLMTLALLLTVFPLAAAADSQSSSDSGLPADGVYDVPFRYLKDDGSGTPSSIHTGYAVEGTGKLTVKEGKASFSHEMKSIPFFTHIAVLKEGQEKAVITRAGQNTTINEADLVRYEPGSSSPIESSATQSGTVTMTIPNIYEEQVVLLHIEMTTPAYSAWHNVVLKLDLSELPVGPKEDDENEQESPTVVLSDINAHWAKSDIERAIKLGFVGGYTDGTFRPDATVSRGEFAVMLSRALELGGEEQAAAPADFGSIPAWAQSHVMRVVTAGIIGGFEDGAFRSEGQLTRAQLAVIIARAAGLALEENATLSFNDEGMIPAWARQEISAAVSAGFIQGKDGNVFVPGAAATRSEAVTLIIRLLDNK